MSSLFSDPPVIPAHLALKSDSDISSYGLFVDLELLISVETELDKNFCVHIQSYAWCQALDCG